jgi:hypothetical protein
VAASMSYFEAAITALERVRKPLTTRQLTEAAIKDGLIKPKGKTPEATMSAELYKRLPTDSRLVKLETPGTNRAVHGTVRWALRKRTR